MNKLNNQNWEGMKHLTKTMTGREYIDWVFAGSKKYKCPKCNYSNVSALRTGYHLRTQHSPAKDKVRRDARINSMYKAIKSLEKSVAKLEQNSKCITGYTYTRKYYKNFLGIPEWAGCCEILGTEQTSTGRAKSKYSMRAYSEFFGVSEYKVLKYITNDEEPSNGNIQQ